MTAFAAAENPFSALVESIIGESQPLRLRSRGVADLAEALGGHTQAERMVFSIQAAALQLADSLGDIVRATVHDLSGGRRIRETIVVGYGPDATQTCLLLLVDGLPDEVFVSRVPGAVWAAPRTLSRDIRPAVALEAGTSLYRQGVVIDPAALLEAVLELSERDLVTVIARPPDTYVTSGIPASAVRANFNGDVIASVGLVAQRSDYDPPVMTTALHAIELWEEEGLEVLGSRVTVKARDRVTDSALLEFEDVPWKHLHELPTSEILGIAPRYGEPVQFTSSPRNQIVASQLTGFDPSVVLRQHQLTSKVYTNPDTVPGDSGAALLDGDHRTLGLAAYRTEFDAPLPFAVWVWAAQVAGVFGLSP